MLASAAPELAAAAAAFMGGLSPCAVAGAWPFGPGAAALEPPGIAISSFLRRAFSSLSRMADLVAVEHEIVGACEHLAVSRSEDRLVLDARRGERVVRGGDLRRPRSANSGNSVTHRTATPSRTSLTPCRCGARGCAEAAFATFALSATNRSTSPTLRAELGVDRGARLGGERLGNGACHAPASCTRANATAFAPVGFDELGQPVEERARQELLRVGPGTRSALTMPPSATTARRPGSPALRLRR